MQSRPMVPFTLSLLIGLLGVVTSEPPTPNYMFGNYDAPTYNYHDSNSQYRSGGNQGDDGSLTTGGDYGYTSHRPSIPYQGPAVTLTQSYSPPSIQYGRPDGNNDQQPAYGKGSTPKQGLQNKFKSAVYALKVKLQNNSPPPTNTQTTYQQKGQGQAQYYNSQQTPPTGNQYITLPRKTGGSSDSNAVQTQYPTKSYYRPTTSSSSVSQTYGRGPPIPPNPMQQYRGSQPQPMQQYGGSQPQPMKQYGGSQPQPKKEYGGSQPQPKKQYGGSQPQPMKQYGGSQSQPMKQYGSSQPQPKKQYGGSQPQPMKQYGGSQPQPMKQYGGSKPQPKKQYGGSKPQPKKQYGGSKPQPIKQYGGYQPKPMKQYGGYQPKPMKQYGGYQPPTTEPPTTEPPTTEPPTTEPPTTEPPTTEPPTTEPPTTEPPTTEPPTTEPPTTEPPTTEPPMMYSPKMYPPKMYPPMMYPPMMDPTMMEPPMMDPTMMEPPMMPPPMMQSPPPSNTYGPPPTKGQYKYYPKKPVNGPNKYHYPGNPIQSHVTHLTVSYKGFLSPPHVDSGNKQHGYTSTSYDGTGLAADAASNYIRRQMKPLPVFPPTDLSYRGGYDLGKRSY